MKDLQTASTRSIEFAQPELPYYLRTGTSWPGTVFIVNATFMRILEAPSREYPQAIDKFITL